MEDDGLRPSRNIDDRRGMGGGAARGGLGIGAVLVLCLIGWATGIDPRLLIGGAEMVTGSNQPSVSQQQGRQGAPTDQMGNFVARVLGETEDAWTVILPQQAGRQYVKPVLVLYSGVTGSACGTAQSAMGPFYCPRDQKLYLDTSFFQDMQRKLGGGGRFALCLCHRARGGTPRAEPDRTSAEGAASTGSVGFAAGECDFRADGTDGGLLCGRVGVPHGPASP